MEACPIPPAAEPCAIVIFGASGDLTKRKLLPALYNLGSYHLLPAHFSIIGVARRPLSDDIFRDQLGKDLAELGTQPVDPNLWGKFRERISYCAGEFDKPHLGTRRCFAPYPRRSASVVFLGQTLTEHQAVQII